MLAKHARMLSMGDIKFVRISVTHSENMREMWMTGAGMVDVGEEGELWALLFSISGSPPTKNIHGLGVLQRRRYVFIFCFSSAR